MNVLQRLKTNWKSGLTTALVSIPLSISLAVASNSTPIAGIVTAIWAGLIASFFGGSNYNIVGPTGALSGILAMYALVHGAEALPILAIVTGGFILLAYAFRLEKYLFFIPSSVIHGFTLGVAFIIGLNQLIFALVLTGLQKHEAVMQNILESFRHVGEASGGAIFTFLAFLIGLFLFKKFLPRLPGAIILSPLGILLGYTAGRGLIPVSLDTLGSNFSGITARLFIWPQFELTTALIGAGLTVALVAILETMLSAKIADGMTKTKHDERKEMFGLGLANIASGLAGGIPATAALARTALNIKTGADSRLSATVNSIAIAVISLLLFSYFQYIPMAVIAAILVYTAVQMVESEHFVRLYRYDRHGFAISFFVAIVTIVKDPIMGILLGASVSLLLFVERLSVGQFELSLHAPNQGVVSVSSDEKLKEITENSKILLYTFRAKLSYINSRAHITRFESNLVKYKHIILRFREVYFVDLDGVEAFDEIVGVIERRGQGVLVTGLAPHVKTFLRDNSHCFRRLESEGQVFEKAREALASLGIPLP